MLHFFQRDLGVQNMEDHNPSHWVDHGDQPILPTDGWTETYLDISALEDDYVSNSFMTPSSTRHYIKCSSGILGSMKLSATLTSLMCLDQRSSRWVDDGLPYAGTSGRRLWKTGID